MNRYIYFLLLLLFPLLPAEGSAPANANLLKDTVIKEFTLEGANLREAIDQLRELTQNGEEQVNFVIAPDVKAEEKVLTMDVRGISGMDALATILQMSGTRAELKRGSIWILPNP